MTPESLDEFAKRLRDLKGQLFGDAQILSPIAEEHVLLAVQAVGMAVSQVTLAKYHLMRKE